MTREPRPATGSSSTRRPGERVSLYVWAGVVLAAAVIVVVISWHARGGTPDPTAATGAHLVRRRMLLGLALLGFTSVYRECFEVVVFLQNLRELYGASVVLEGVVIGLLFTAAVGTLTFALHQRLPYRRLLIITGVLLLFVLLVQVGEEVNEMQLAGWIATTQIHWLAIPGWMGTWLSLFNNWETFAAQFLALAVVVGSYVLAQYLRVWRPRRRGREPARFAERIPIASVPQAHPQAVEPLAGAQAPASPAAGPVITGDTNAHAPPLSQVKRELVELNLCGGATSAAQANPVVAGAGPGFVADPGTVQDVGELPVLTARLDALAKALHVTIYGISGYRTPAHSVAVGGYANDPHTKGEAEDIGVNSLLRSSAAQISEPELARYGLYRPFDPTDNPANSEVNHIQLIPTGGPVPLVVADATFAPDPTCK